MERENSARALLLPVDHVIYEITAAEAAMIIWATVVIIGKNCSIMGARIACLWSTPDKNPSLSWPSFLFAANCCKGRFTEGPTNWRSNRPH